MRVAGLGLLSLLLITACGPGVPDLSKETSQFPRTDRKSWSSTGWEGLRWGMGPGDVQVHLGPKGMNLGGKYQPITTGMGMGGAKRYELLESGRTVGGEKMIVVFGFEAGRLASVLERPMINTGTEFSKFAAWATAARDELAKKFGDPKEELGKDYLAAADRQWGRRYDARWESKKFWGAVILASVADLEVEDASVRAVDPKRAAEYREKRNAQVQEKLKDPQGYRKKHAMEQMQEQQ